MRIVRIGLALLCLVVAALPAHNASAESLTFTEHFRTAARLDALHTTAHWDTSSGLLKLPPTEPLVAHTLGVLHEPLGNFPAVYVPEKGRAYLIGGRYHWDGPTFDVIREYDPVRNVVEREMSAKLPTPRDGTAAAYATVAGKIYIFGGRDIHEFDPFSDTLTTIPTQLPYALSDAASAYVPGSNKIYLFGGHGRSGAIANILEFDVGTHRVAVLSHGLPTARGDACAAFVPQTGRIYVFGGQDRAGVRLDEVLAFDPATGQVTTLETRLPLGLTKSAAVYVPSAGRVFLFGGEREGELPWHEVLEFRPSSGSISMGPYHLPRWGLRDVAAVYAPDSGWLVILGGDARRAPWTDEQYDGILRLRWEGSRLKQYDNFLPAPTHTSSAVYVPEQDRAYLFGGNRPDIVEFDPKRSLARTMRASLPASSTDPGVVWAPDENLAYVFDRAGIYTYDPAADLVATKPASLPSGFDPRVAAFAPSRNAVYLFDSAEGSGLILRYDLVNDTLTTMSARLLPARRGAYAVYVPGSNLIFVMGGWSYQSENWSDAIWVFDVASETLTRQQELLMPIPGVYKASVRMPTTSNIYLFGVWGGWSDYYAFASEHIWHFDSTPIRKVVEHTLTQPSTLGYQAAVWASAEDRFYAFGGFWKTAPDKMGSSNRIQRFDVGHTRRAVVQSTRINSDDFSVLRATLTTVQQLNGGSVDYFLSNNGAASWEAVTPGQEHTFTAQGCDLRWKAVLHGDGLRTPMVDQLTIVHTAAAVALHSPADGSHICDGTPDFDWSDVHGATSYRIEVDDDAGFASPAIDSTTVTSNYTPPSPLSPGSYFWQVRATASGQSDVWSPVWRFTIDTVPAAPGSASPADGAAGVPVDANLDWSDASGATSYDVYFGTSPTPPHVANVTVSAYDLPTLSASLDYYWQIVAKSACGDAPGPVWRFRTGLANHTPQNHNLWPDHGGRPAGRRVNFTATYRDLDGWRDLAQLYLHIGSSTAARNNCRLRYYVRGNKMYLLNNAGTGWLGGFSPGSARVIRNRQCTLSCARSTVTKSGRLVRVKWNLVFRTGFRGRKNSYMQATDIQGARTAWQLMGTWRVQ